MKNYPACKVKRISLYFYFLQLYQYYGKRKPEDVHKILSDYKTDYIILEDSICLAPSKNGCRVPDLIDVDNGVVSIFICCDKEFKNIQCEYITSKNFNSCTPDKDI